MTLEEDVGVILDKILYHWKEVSEEGKTISVDDASSTTYRLRSELRDLVKKNMELALLSPDYFVRRYAENMKEDK